jgi:hypothetical protein
LLVDGCPKHLASSTEVTLLLNFDYQSKTCVLLTDCPPKATVNIFKRSVAICPYSEEKYGAEMKFFKVYQFQGTPKL